MGLLQGLGQAKPVSEFVNMTLKYQEAGNQNALSKMQIQKEEMQLSELQKQQEQLDTVVDFRMSPFFLSLPESARPQAEQTFKSMGAFDENYRGTRRQMYQALGELEKNKDAFKLMMAPVVEAKGEAVVKAFEKMRGSPEDPKLKAAYESARMDYEASSGKLIEHLAALDKQGAEADKPFTLGEGQQRFDGQGNVIASGQPKEPQPTKTRTIKEGDIERTEEWVDGAWKEIATAPRYKPTTSVNVAVDMGLSKGARAKAEEDVQESTDMYKGLENLVTISKPDFFTYKGQIQAGAERLGEKAGVVKDPKFLKDYSSWEVGTEQEFNKYRKWATGVAAGEKELERLAGSFPNVNMSKTQYMAAAKQTAINAWKLAERRRRALNAGINDPGKQKDFYRLLPLDSMPEPPAEVIQRFSPKSKFEIIGVE